MLDKDPRLERSHLSPLNRPLRALDGTKPKFIVREIALRQSAHNNGDLTLEEKLFWLKALDDAGVARAALRVADLDAGDIVIGARDMGLRIRLELYGQGWIKENWRRVIATARVSGAKAAYVTSRGSDWALQDMARLSGSGPTLAQMRREMLDACIDCIKAMRDADLEVSFAIPYATQADQGFVEDFAGEAEVAGAGWVQLCDSMGGATPVAFRALVSGVKRILGRAKIDVHCHDDIGLGLANVIASAEVGAEGADVIVDGAEPRRVGIAALAEVAVALELGYGVDTGIELKALTRLSRLHERLFNWPTPAHAPIVGREAFMLHFAAGRHVDYGAGEIKSVEHDAFYTAPGNEGEPFNAEAVGNEYVHVLGRFSGPNEVEKRLADIGMTVSDGELKHIVTLVQERGRAFKRHVTDEELRYFVELSRATTPSERIGSPGPPAASGPRHAVV